MNLSDKAIKALNDFSRDVISREFPAKQHTFRAPNNGLMMALKKELTNRHMLTEAPKKKLEDPIERVLVIGGGALGKRLWVGWDLCLIDF